MGAQAIQKINFDTKVKATIESFKKGGADYMRSRRFGLGEAPSIKDQLAKYALVELSNNITCELENLYNDSIKNGSSVVCEPKKDCC